MSNLGNKETMSKNLKYYMESRGIDRIKLCTDLNIKYTTLTDWIKGNTYPRIDKIEKMANYFGIRKSDLVEEHTNALITVEINEKEKLLLDCFHKLTPEEQEFVLRAVTAKFPHKE